MDKGVAFLLLTLLLASTLYPQTTLAKTKSFRVGGSIGWSKETHGSWFPTGTIFYAGDSLGDSHHYLYSLLDYTYIHIPTVNAITPI